MVVLLETKQPTPFLIVLVRLLALSLGFVMKILFLF
jgi:hypothetical protein